MEFLNELRTQELINETKSRLAAKQDTLIFDDTPTENSNNPVKSGGVYSANQNIYEVMGQNGAKNLIPYPYFDGISKTNNGVTYTVNDDGSITANGTATAASRFYLMSSSSSNIPNGNYIISDGDVGDSTSNVQVALWNGGTYTGVVYITNNGEKAFTLSDTPTRTGTSIYVSVTSGTTVSNLVFKPMIRFATDSDATYQPYAKTNSELTAENQTLTNQLTNEVTTRATLGAHNLFGVGNSLGEWFAATNDGKLPTSYLASDTITGTVDKDTNSIVITAYNNTGYRWGCKKINLKKNTRYTFSRTSCDGTIQLFGKNNADDRAVVVSGLSNGGTVNSGDYDWWYIGFYPTRSGGYFSITDLLVRLETDADTTYQPYVKTNQQLTEDKAEQTEVNDIVNVYGAKNLLPFDIANIIARNTGGTWSGNTYTFNGVTFTVNDDGSVTVDGTATAITEFILVVHTGNVTWFKNLIRDKTVTLSGCPSGGGATIYTLRKWGQGSSGTYYDTGNGVTFTADAESLDNYNWNFQIRIYNGITVSNLTFYPMLRLASIEDDTYEPYTKTNRELTGYVDNMEVNGAVNMLDSAIATQTVNDITVTNNGDGSYTVNCSSTEHNSANFISTKKVTLPKGTYKWTASADGKSPIGSNDCYAFIRGVNGTVDWYRSYQYSHGYGIITLTQDSEIEFGLTVAANATVSHLTFKPMIAVPSYNGDYVPYAKSNKELTEDVAPEYFDLSVRGNRCTILSQNNCKVGKQVFIWCAITYTETTANAPVLTVPSGYLPQSVVGTNYGIPINILDGSSPSDHTVARYARVYSSGELDIYNVEQNKTYVISGCYITN